MRLGYKTHTARLTHSSAAMREVPIPLEIITPSSAPMLVPEMSMAITTCSLARTLAIIIQDRAVLLLEVAQVIATPTLQIMFLSDISRDGVIQLATTTSSSVPEVGMQQLTALRISISALRPGSPRPQEQRI